MTLADFTIDSRAAEREFVDYSRHVGLRKLKAHCFGRLGELDPEGLALREARQRRDRFVSITDGPDGMLTLFGKLDVVTGAPIKALLESMSAAALRRQRQMPREERFTPGQLTADALSDVAQHALGCRAVPRRPKTTVVIRMGMADVVDDLRDAGLVDERGIPTARGRALASCDGVLQPITPGTARLMAVEAQLLPAVMGGDSLPLDLGRSKRLFTKAQTTAIADRDRGCIRCAAPPAFCHTHHVKFWSDDGLNRRRQRSAFVRRLPPSTPRAALDTRTCRRPLCGARTRCEHEHDGQNAAAGAIRIDNPPAPTATRSSRWRSVSLPLPRERGEPSHQGVRHASIQRTSARQRATALSASEDGSSRRPRAGCPESRRCRSASW